MLLLVMCRSNRNSYALFFSVARFARSQPSIHYRSGKHK